MFSLDNLRSAWERVRENEGCAGSDGVTIAQFAGNAERRIERLREAVVDRTYRPLPLLEILVQKSPESKKVRRLLVPSVCDRVLQTAAARMISYSLEEQFLDASYAYRPGRGVDSAIARVMQLRDRGYVWVVDADISAYFDEVDHAALRKLLAMERMEEWLHDLIRLWIGGEVWNGERLRPLTKGIPQGSPLSPVLANLFLHDLDAELSRDEYHIVRYADDFVVLCPGEPEAREAMRIAHEWLTSRKLTFHPEKTRLTQFKEGFHFLGVRFTEDEALVPWKYKRPQGQVLRMAKPLPPSLLRRYSYPKPRSAMRIALEASEQSRPEIATETGRRTGVAFLYLTEQGSVLRKSGQRFLVEKESRILLDLPYHKLDAVLVFGNVQITTQALGELMEKGIPVSFLSRQGRFRGSVNGPGGRDIPLRLAQFRTCGDPVRRLAMSAELISAKIRNCAEVLGSYEAREGVTGHTLIARSDQARTVSSAESLLGIEGSAAREYFDSLMKFNRSEFIWPGRLKYPARDPLNALLSLAYTLLMAETTGLLEGHGLDPYLGFLHEADYGRVSLALDLIEPFRGPVADRFVLNVVNRRMAQDGDFAGRVDAVDGQKDRPLYLVPEALGRFLAYWEEWMNAEPPARGGAPAAKPFRRELRRQVETLTRHLRGEAAWEPWRWDHHQSPEEDACDSLSATT